MWLIPCPTAKTLEADHGGYLGYVRLVGRRRGETELAGHITPVPTQYTKTPLLRDEEGPDPA
jgi:hypothetical protein